MSDLVWNIGYGHFLVLAAVLFLIGVLGVLIRRNALIILMSVELMPPPMSRCSRSPGCGAICRRIPSR
jgi:hypothetical protein